VQKEPTYHLHQWRIAGIHGGERVTRTRGPKIVSFYFYEDLKAAAKALAIDAGYPASQWGVLYDWSKS
jgi:hypothetical protein